MKLKTVPDITRLKLIATGCNHISQKNIQRIRKSSIFHIKYSLFLKLQSLISLRNQAFYIKFDYVAVRSSVNVWRNESAIKMLQDRLLVRFRIFRITW